MVSCDLRDKRALLTMDLATVKRKVARHSEFDWHGGYSGPVALARRRGAAVAAFARLCAV